MTVAGILFTSQKSHAFRPKTPHFVVWVDYEIDARSLRRFARYLDFGLEASKLWPGLTLMT